MTLRRVGLVALLFGGLLSGFRAEAQTKRILVVGDSWAQQSSSRWTGQFNGNGAGSFSALNTGIAGMTAAALNTPGFLSSQIINPLMANPTIDMVHLSIGGNDFLGTWKASDDAATRASKFAAIQSNVQGIVNNILSVRPNVQVTISSYDYLNFVDNVNPFGNSQNQANFLLWNNMGLPSAGQLNRAMFGDAGGGMEDYKEGVSSGNSRVHYYSIQGFNQAAGGGWGGLYGLDFPTPTNRMGNSGQDAIHLNSAGYDLWIDQGFNTVYNGLFSNATLATNPGNGGTINVGNVLVGQAEGVAVTAANAGPVGSRLEASFGTATGEFSGGSGTRYAFVDQVTGGDVLAENYTYTPTARGFDSQGLTISTNVGNSSFTIIGTGVAPVNQVASVDAGLTRIGTTSTAVVNVFNNGDGNLSGLGAVSNLQGSVGSVAGSTEFSGAGGSINLADLTSTSFNYSYTPTNRGVDSGLVLASLSNGNTNGTNTAQVVGVNVTGQGVGSDFQISNSVFNFGDVSLGGSASIGGNVLNLSSDFNAGNLDLTNLTLFSTSISGPDSGSFSLSAFTPGTVLGQSGSTPFSIDFNANGGTGLRNATLTFYTDQGAAFGASGQAFSFSLTGNVIAAADEILSVASTDNSRLMNLNADGDGTIFAENPTLVSPIDVAHDADGNRYVADAALSRVMKYDSLGNATIFADGSDGLLLPTSLKIDDSGNVFVANYLTDQIVRIDSLGNASIFSDSADGLQNPFGLALDSTGSLFVAEVDSRRILVLDSLGNTTVFADAADGLITPVGMEFDGDGNLYVADAALSKIFKFDTLGNVSIFADNSDGVFFPTGLAFDSEGNLYVSNYVTDQIIKIDSLGVGSVFATASDGISGPFGLDLLMANAAFAPLAARLQLAAVPEASSLLFAGVAAVATIVVRRRRR